MEAEEEGRAVSNPKPTQALAKGPQVWPMSAGAQILAHMIHGASGSCKHSWSLGILTSGRPERFTVPSLEKSKPADNADSARLKSSSLPEGKPVSA